MSKAEQGITVGKRQTSIPETLVRPLLGRFYIEEKDNET